MVWAFLAHFRRRISRHWLATALGWGAGLTVGTITGGVFVAGIGLDAWLLSAFSVGIMAAVAYGLRCGFVQPQTANKLQKQITPAKPVNAPPLKPAVNESKPVHVPTPEHLAQIEQARQSSLATLRAQDQARKAAAKAARQVQAIPPGPALEPIELPDRVAFTYKRSDGTLSSRTVVVNKLDEPGGKFTGFCESSGSVKTFKAGSVQGAVTRQDTGEIVDALLWFSALHPSAKANTRPKTKTPRRARI